MDAPAQRENHACLNLYDAKNNLAEPLPDREDQLTKTSERVEMKNAGATGNCATGGVEERWHDKKDTTSWPLKSVISLVSHFGDLAHFDNMPSTCVLIAKR